MGSAEYRVLSPEKEVIAVRPVTQEGKLKSLKIAWQRARGLTMKIYQVSQKVEFGRDYRLSGQIQGAAVSVMSNIAEGFKRWFKVSSISFCRPQRRRAPKFDRNYTLPSMSAT